MGYVCRVAVILYLSCWGYTVLHIADTDSAGSACVYNFLIRRAVDFY
uniref:Uncharacterized protein n=1 Tax=Arundo donax TaxID=35708 RepID=A0A0A9AA94_ARUDO